MGIRFGRLEMSLHMVTTYDCVGTSRRRHDEIARQESREYGWWLGSGGSRSIYCRDRL